MNFANILRHVLRQDPDVVMVGEIRDRETAEIAIQAALTGHLVISTLHTNDSSGAITRLLDMGIEGFLISSALIGVLAQRLVRKICLECKHTFMPPPSLYDEAAWQGRRPTTLWRGRGCKACLDSGYKGRMGIYELLDVDGPMRDLILREPTIDDIRLCRAKSGYLSLKESGYELVADGVTTIEEVMRAVVIESTSDTKTAEEAAIAEQTTTATNTETAETESADNVNTIKLD
jgi:type II secretory ATPase GspE/PulE/Tfp pilus assembly ATPase PilB-like protein